jgi:hypothetical protein
MAWIFLFYFHVSHIEHGDFYYFPFGPLLVGIKKKAGHHLACHDDWSRNKSRRGKEAEAFHA